MWYSIREVLKRIFFQNLGITKVLAVERDVKPRNMNFAKVERGWGLLISRGVCTDKYGNVLFYLLSSSSGIISMVSIELCHGVIYAVNPATSNYI